MRITNYYSLHIHAQRQANDSVRLVTHNTTTVFMCVTLDIEIL